MPWRGGVHYAPDEGLEPIDSDPVGDPVADVLSHVDESGEVADPDDPDYQASLYMDQGEWDDDDDPERGDHYSHEIDEPAPYATDMEEDAWNDALFVAEEDDLQENPDDPSGRLAAWLAETRDQVGPKIRGDPAAAASAPPKTPSTELVKRANKGEAEAQFLLAVRLEDGDGIREDAARAAYWYRRAAEQGHSGAQHGLGGLYEFGRGVPADLQEAERWYAKAKLQLARKGTTSQLPENARKEPDGRSQGRPYRVSEEGSLNGIRYRVLSFGEGLVGLDLEGVVLAPRKLEERHHVCNWIRSETHRQARLREEARSGREDPKPRPEERKRTEIPRRGGPAEAKFSCLLGKAQAGDTEAQYLVGRRYQFGDGVRADPAEAYYWTRMAARKGHGSAQVRLAEMLREKEGRLRKDEASGETGTRTGEGLPPKRNPRPAYGRTGEERAREHVREAKALEERLGPEAIAVVKRWLFSLRAGEAAYEALLADYEAINGPEARVYLEGSYASWRDGRKRMSGQTLMRLIDLVPRRAPAEVKIEIADRIWRWAGTDPTPEERPVPVENEQEAIEAISKAWSGLVVLPEKIRKEIEWLADEDVEMLGRLRKTLQKGRGTVAVQRAVRELRAAKAKTLPPGASVQYRVDVRTGAVSVTVGGGAVTWPKEGNIFLKPFLCGGGAALLSLLVGLEGLAAVIATFWCMPIGFALIVTAFWTTFIDSDDP